MSEHDPLVLPQDEFELVRKVAEAAGLAAPLAEVKASLRLRIAEGKLAAAEAKLAALRGLCDEYGWMSHASWKQRVLAIIGTEEEPAP